MNYKVETIEEYLAVIPEERKDAFAKLRSVILENLPAGFEETMLYGMPAYVVPHSLYPDGYHCKPSDPLPFINIASQKNFVALYHMGIYADPALLAWFQEEYPKHSKTKLNMGKSCIRFKNVKNIPYDLIAELVARMPAEQWIGIYDANKPK
ncbi:MAG: DUF1801 domain-containing protein [Rhodothermales bacterium]